MMEWKYERWHLDGTGIHAGDMLELLVGDRWVLVRIESKDAGRRLFAHLNLDPPLQRFHAVSQIVTPDRVQAWVDDIREEHQGGIWDDATAAAKVENARASLDLLRWPGRRR